MPGHVGDDEPEPSVRQLAYSRRNPPRSHPRPGSIPRDRSPQAGILDWQKRTLDVPGELQVALQTLLLTIFVEEDLTLKRRPPSASRA